MSARFALDEAAALLGAERVGSGADFVGVSTDSRQVVPGSLFVALVGPHFDGHDYVSAALAGGAVAALVSRPPPGAGPLLVVADTRVALGALAAAWRARFMGPVVGITGSVGKTTVKEMTAAILGRQGAVHATRGNLNNDIGLPLTLLELDPAHGAAVIEMGANHAGEIAELTRIARPGVGLVTNAGPVHLEGFGSVEGVARAKGELFAGLAPGATAVINADDPFSAIWFELAADRRQLTFGVDADADVTTDPARIENGRRPGLRFPLETPIGRTTIELPLAGRHHVCNALAAAAAALAAGATLDMVREGLAEMTPIPGRLQRRAGLAGALVIDDTYNANPSAFAAAIEMLAGLPGRRWLAVGEMGELGEGSRRWHAWVGDQARARGIDRLLAVGPLAGAAAEAFGDGGESFVGHGDLVAALRADLADDVTVLVKGSRSARMERVVAGLLGDGGEGGV